MSPLRPDDDDDTDGDPYATGFAVSRRTVLATGVAIGLAGCPSEEDNSTPTNTPSPTEPVSGLVDGNLTVLDSGFVSRQSGLQNYFRIRVRNDLQNETMSSVGLIIEFFDPDLQFLEHQNATIAYLGPREVFEGYVTYFSDDAVAWSIRATRTQRTDELETLTGLSVTGDSLDDDVVRGTVEDNGPDDIRRLAVRAGFFDSDDDRLGTNYRTITELPAGGAQPVEIDLPDVIGDTSVQVADYALSVGDIADTQMSVR
jgi:hypothetical protein